MVDQSDIAWSVTLTTPAAAEPVTLDDAKHHLRVDSNSDDALITTIITAARDMVQSRTGQQLISATRTLYLDAWPEEIHLPYGPVQSITTVKYYDTDGAQQTMSAADYQLDGTLMPPRLKPAYGGSWPSARAQYRSIEVAYVCGHGATGAAIPPGLYQGLLLLIAHWYENREAGSPVALHEIPIGVDALLNGHATRWTW